MEEQRELKRLEELFEGYSLTKKYMENLESKRKFFVDMESQINGECRIMHPQMPNVPEIMRQRLEEAESRNAKPAEDDGKKVSRMPKISK